MKQPAVYFLASARNGTIYTGVTSNLIQRIWQHKENLVEGFTKRYGVHLLVWFEMHPTMETAIAREKRLKNLNRREKLRLIERDNPQWRDIYYDLL